MNIINPVNHNSHHCHTELPLPSEEPPCPVPSHILGAVGQSHSPFSLLGVGLGATDVAPSPAVPEAGQHNNPDTQHGFQDSDVMGGTAAEPPQPWEKHTPPAVKHEAK